MLFLQVKKVKVTAKEIGEQLKASEVASQLIALEKAYAESQVSQCEMLADFLWKTFRDVDLPFNKLLADQPCAKVHRHTTLCPDHRPPSSNCSSAFPPPSYYFSCWKCGPLAFYHSRVLKHLSNEITFPPSPPPLHLSKPV
jgi:hypothetical protein